MIGCGRKLLFTGWGRVEVYLGPVDIRIDGEMSFIKVGSKIFCQILYGIYEGMVGLGFK